MGEVYEARDLELGVPVALKCLPFPPEASGSAATGSATARFKSEIQLARKVTHPNVCRIYDLGRHSTPQGREILFLTMELLSGETLAERLGRDGPMSPGSALPLVQQMADALSAAHQADVIHRDFKSSNVMLVRSGPTGTRVVVTDFGLAHSLVRSEGGSPSLTATGQFLGTPAYMAPEQLTGGEVQPTTDIYAFGVVLYEMITGARPFPGASLDSVLRRLQEPAPSPRTHIQDLHPAWEAVILRCLERNPSDRPQKAEEVVQALTSGAPTWEPRAVPRLPSRRTALGLLGLAAVLLLVAAVLLRGRLWDRTAGVPAEKHIAVLPFTNIGEDPENQAFCEGVVETLASKLSQLEQFQKSFWVVPSSEARRVSNPAEAHRVLGVTLVVTGSIQRLGSDVRLIANLVDAGTRKQLASRSIDAGASELVELQDRVWERVADMLQIELQPEARRTLTAGGTRVPGAFEYYEQGLGYMRRYGLENTDRAIDLFEKALEKDPLYALAYAGLGEAYSNKYQLTKDPPLVELARKSGRRAVELNDKLAPVHLTMGQIHYQTGHYPDAIREFRRTLEIDPSAVNAYVWLGRVYDDVGKIQEAEASYKTAINLRPTYWLAYNGLGFFYYRHGQFEKAVPQFRTIISLAPDNSLAYDNLGGVYLQMGRYDEAVSILKRAIELRGSASAYSNLGCVYMFQGRFAEAVPMMEEAVKRRPKHHPFWRNLGDAYRWTPGQDARASEAYRRALELAEAQLAVKPDDAFNLGSAALYRAKLEDRDKALGLIAKALRLAPADTEVVFKSALVYELTGDRQRALRAVAEARKGGYSVEQIEKEPELARLREDARYRTWNQGR
jgi:serine/threonine-protein kinase